jgi:hypothetical protein
VIQQHLPFTGQSSRSSQRFRWAYLPLFALVLASSSAPAAAPQPPAGTVSIANYQAKLQSLDQILASCQRAMTPANCQSDRVGPDLKLALPSGTRQIRLAWLRDLLDTAAKDQAAKDEAARYKLPRAQTSKPENPPQLPQKQKFQPPALTQQLQDGRQRLVSDGESAAQYAAPASGQPLDKVAAHPAADSSPQRQILARILAAKEYNAAIARPSLLRQVLEKIGNWLDRVIAKLQQAGFRSRWVGLAAEIGFGIFVCVALAWLLIRLERQGRLGAAGFRPQAAPGVASARDWQLWLRDAQQAAGQGAWRDAIHFLYWGSISRLESGGLWPADRARTPREYLALLSANSAQRPDLAALTHSFERTWYGGRPAAESDFHQAEQVAAQLGVQPGLQSGVRSGARLDAHPSPAEPQDGQEAR